jgi:hypothetical protein
MTKRLPLPLDLKFMAPVIVPDLVRMGKDWDGGYVISAQSVDQAQGMLSLGVNHDWSFDRDWHQRKPQDRIHAYDGTISPSRFHADLQQDYRDFFGGRAEHFPVNVGSTTCVGQSSFDDVMMRMNRDRIFLKMDIEGGEWQLTDDIASHARAITGMVIEFHNTDRLRPLFLGTMRRYQEQFHIVHIHANTSCALAQDNFPTVVEISFLNRDLWAQDEIQYECHQPDLDQPNLPDTEDIALFWEEPDDR